MEYECQCSDGTTCRPNAILYNILSRTDETEPTTINRHYFSPKRCHCERRRSVLLKTPQDTCHTASSILVKTVHFMKSLAAFQQLPPKDRLVLLQKCWAPLFVLGLAQEHVAFEVEEAPAPSMLKRILLNRQDADSSDGRGGPTLSGVQKLVSCLRKFWSLDLSPKEYAYLKGALIFNPDVPGLRAVPFVEGLQREAQHALKEVVVLLHPEESGRFARVLLAGCTLDTVTPDLITELFFRPIIGQAHLLDLLVDMLFSR